MFRSLCATLLAAVLAVALSAGLHGCSRPAEGGAGSGSGNKKDTSNQLYIEVAAIWSHPYFTDHKEGIKRAGEIYGVKTEYIGPMQYDLHELVAAMEQAIARKPAGILVVGMDPSLGALIDKAMAQGIPVVTLDGDVPDCKRIAFVGTGNFQAGYMSGKKLAELVGGKGKVAILTKVGQPNLEERIAGYKKALAEFPGMELVQIGDTQSKPNISAQTAAAILQKYPDLAGIGCVEGAGGMGAATAVREAKKAGQVKIVAMDRGNDLLEQIREGTIQASVVQQTALMPIYGVGILYNLNNNPVAIASDNAKAGITGAPTVIDTGVVIVDKNTCELFMRK